MYDAELLSRARYFTVCSECGTQLNKQAQRRWMAFIPRAGHFGCPFCASAYLEVLGILIRLPH